MKFTRQSLVRDGSLVLSIDARLLGAASQWMPSLPTTSESEHPGAPAILADIGKAVEPPLFAKGKPDLRLGATDCWTDAGSDTAFVRNDDRTITASVDLARRNAQVVASDADVDTRDMTSVLTLVSALLLLRDGRTAIHAGAVTRPGASSVWLLLGDSHSGKSTTTANLVKAGWSYLSDDYVVLSGDQRGIGVEGWPEDFHVDEGWSRGDRPGRAAFSVRRRFRRERAGTTAPWRA